MCEIAEIRPEELPTRMLVNRPAVREVGWTRWFNYLRTKSQLPIRLPYCWFVISVHFVFNYDII